MVGSCENQPGAGEHSSYYFGESPYGKGTCTSCDNCTHGQEGSGPRAGPKKIRHRPQIPVVDGAGQPPVTHPQCLISLYPGYSFRSMIDTARLPENPGCYLYSDDGRDDHLRRESKEPQKKGVELSLPKRTKTRRPEAWSPVSPRSTLSSRIPRPRPSSSKTRS